VSANDIERQLRATLGPSALSLTDD
jgi:hypothetical protein